METNEISHHQFKVYDYVRLADSWLTSKEIASGTGVAERTARAHALKFVKLGIFDLAEVFPAHRYRVAKLADKRNRGMFDRLEAVREIFELPD